MAVQRSKARPRNVALACDAPGCPLPAEWFVGIVLDDQFGQGHPCCRAHLAEALDVTYAQRAKKGRVDALVALPLSKSL